jgi:signal transduction histidine kinase
VTPDEFLAFAKVLPEGMLLVSGEGTVLAANRAAGDLLGMRPETLTGTNLVKVATSPPEKIKAYLHACSRSGQMMIGLLSFHFPLGEKIDCRAEGAVLSPGTKEKSAEIILRLKPKASGSSQFILLNRQIHALTREIALRRQTEEELKRKTLESEEANRIKSQFLSNVSHELRTPLNAILGYTSLILDHVYGSVAEEQREPLEGVRRNADELLKLVDDVLDLSKIESGKVSLDLAPLDITALIQDVLAGMKLFIEKKSLHLQWDLEEALPKIECDANKIRQVFVNLFSNAIKFTHQGGITISTRNRPEKGGIEISIRDTGLGIRPEELPKIFDVFHQVDATATREFGGVGLGLAIVKEIVHLLKGEIRVESEYGKGSIFTVFLPCKNDKLTVV